MATKQKTKPAKKGKVGGARPGAGRPNNVGKAARRGIFIPQDHLKRISKLKLPSVSAFYREAGELYLAKLEKSQLRLNL